MTQVEDRLRRALAAREQEAPQFACVWQAAEKRHAARRIRHRALAGVAAVVAMAALLPWRSPDVSVLVVEEELLGSTSWSAPSDVLMPIRRTDIYEELPELIKSTEPDGGTLL